MNTALQELRQKLYEDDVKSSANIEVSNKTLIADLEYQHSIYYEPKEKKKRGKSIERYIDELTNQQGMPSWSEENEKRILLPEYTQAAINRLKNAVIPARDMLMSEYIEPMKPTHFLTFHSQSDWRSVDGSRLDEWQRERAEKLARFGFNNMRKRLGVKTLDVISILERSKSGRLHYHAMLTMPERYNQFENPEMEFNKDLFVSWGKTKYTDHKSGAVVMADTRYKNFDVQPMDKADWLICAGYVAKTITANGEFHSLDLENTRVRK